MFTVCLSSKPIPSIGTPRGSNIQLDIPNSPST
jgi:hypothetical protein